MNVALDVLASKVNIARYQSLLSREWTGRTLSEVVSLLWAEVAGSEGVRNLPFRDVLEPESRKPPRRGPHADVVNHIRTFTRYFERDSLPEMPSPEALAGVRRSRLVAQAEAAWTYLVLHTLVHLRGAVGFFHDTQSLLFLIAVHYLLPALRQQRPVHDCLANALSMHAFTAWRESPEHYYYLQSALMDALGNEGQKEENLRLALEVTPAEDESYLTKVQDYWFALLDAGKPRAAWSFLLSVYRTAPHAYLEELEDMMALVGRRLPPNTDAETQTAGKR